MNDPNASPSSLVSAPCARHEIFTGMACTPSAFATAAAAADDGAMPLQVADCSRRLAAVPQIHARLSSQRSGSERRPRSRSALNAIIFLYSMAKSAGRLRFLFFHNPASPSAHIWLLQLYLEKASTQSTSWQRTFRGGPSLTIATSEPQHKRSSVRHSSGVPCLHLRFEAG